MPFTTETKLPRGSRFARIISFALHSINWRTVTGLGLAFALIASPLAEAAQAPRRSSKSRSDKGSFSLAVQETPITANKEHASQTLPKEKQPATANPTANLRQVNLSPEETTAQNAEQTSDFSTAHIPKEPVKLAAYTLQHSASFIRHQSELAQKLNINPAGLLSMIKSIEDPHSPILPNQQSKVNRIHVANALLSAAQTSPLLAFTVQQMIENHFSISALPRRENDPNMGYALDGAGIVSYKWESGDIAITHPFLFDAQELGIELAVCAMHTALERASLNTKEKDKIIEAMKDFKKGVFGPDSDRLWNNKTLKNYQPLRIYHLLEKGKTLSKAQIKDLYQKKDGIRIEKERVTFPVIVDAVAVLDNGRTRVSGQIYPSANKNDVLLYDFTWLTFKLGNIAPPKSPEESEKARFDFALSFMLHFICSQPENISGAAFGNDVYDLLNAKLTDGFNKVMFAFEIPFYQDEDYQPGNGFGMAY